MVFPETKRREHFNEETQATILAMLIDPTSWQRSDTGFNNVKVAGDLDKAVLVECW